MLLAGIQKNRFQSNRNDIYTQLLNSFIIIIFSQCLHGKNHLKSNLKNIKEHIQEAISSSLAGLDVKIGLENPRNPEHGDLSTNIAFLLAKRLKSSPRKIAEEICRAFKVDSDYLERVETAGAGFINFTFSRAYLLRLAAEILTAGENYGRCDIGKGKRVNLEFVSANPTGPLNIVSARAAALGDSLKRILNACGYRAESEFYVNDAGMQIEKLGESVIARYAELNSIEGIEFPEDGYKGEYIYRIAKKYTPTQTVNWNKLTEQDRNHAGLFAVRDNIKFQDYILRRFSVIFDRWYFESLVRVYKKHIEVSYALMNKGLTFEKDGATYFKSTIWGDDEDRVLWTSDGRPTYFLPDIAYHQDKYDRDFEWLIDIWGPDHHGYIPRMKAALQALEHPPETFTVIIAQQVNLIRGGEKVTMSKRAGEMVTMDDLLEEVGVDAARFFFLQRKASAHLDFDLDLAVKETEENPVFYVQYAHARICSIERFAEGEGVSGEPDWDLLKEKEAFDLMRKLAQYPMVVESCGRNLETPRITMYLGELAYSFHRFYQKHRVVTGDKELSAARLGLCRAVKIVLFNGLDLLGVSAPERM